MSGGFFGGGYGNRYGGYRYGSYGGGYGSPLNRFDPYNSISDGRNPLDNEVIRYAEESCRSAFESLESVVQSVSSVSIMLESTYFAIYSSFRAVLGVARHFSSLKHQFVNIPNQLPLVKIVIMLLRKILSLLGLPVTQNSTVKDGELWDKIAEGKADAKHSRFDANAWKDELESSANASSLPLILFLGIFIGAPWLGWSIASKMSKETLNSNWSTGESDHYIATAMYNFNSKYPDEICLKTGEEYRVAPKHLQPENRGWILASTKCGQKGLVPANYIKISKFIRSH